MKKGSNIHNLETLEREIYRLRLEAKNKENQLNSNCEYLQQNFSSLLINSVICKKENHKESFFKSAFKNEKFNIFINKIVDRFSDRASESIDNLFEKVFDKK